MNKTNKKLLIALIVALVGLGIFLMVFQKSEAQNMPSTSAVSVGDLSNVITASGDVETENQATLNFLSSGRVAYVAVKEGDQVQKGQVLANLDTTIASHNETAAEAQYRSSQAALNKVLDDIHLSQYGNGGFGNVGTANETETQKAARQQAEEASNVAFDNMQNAKKQLELQSIIAPFDGKILSIQNISEGVNATPGSGNAITVVGSGTLKFVANVSEQNVSQMKVGQNVKIKLDGQNSPVIDGTISNIAAGKTTLPNGQNVVKVSVTSAQLQGNFQPGLGGSIEIDNSQSGEVVIPSWLVLGNKYVWVLVNGQATLKQVEVGDDSSGKTVIKSGLSKSDQLILNPQVIAKNKYRLL